ncbi:hypothetical protein P691DRAFT_803637 [Macrolepiota fuliginosa MF-IS2]|uniref:F-box domain-containing protein n=1 Tax=Macrolepiota fuliginosa MF-IS2 TaxID=1400762 RepID=A0A9P6BZU1_9AGAR|nr:hypothetical protein P691DRAFT_803637 [Macrolepiota fuliginosa MF-IS2]
MPGHPKRKGPRERRRERPPPKPSNPADTQHHTSIICKLPYDILSEIFKQVCAPSDLDEQPIVPPTRLGAVCTHWRHAAWSTPHLWTFLLLTGGFWLSKNRIGVLNLYFTNIGALTLSLAINDYPTDPARGRKRRGNHLLGHHIIDRTVDFPARDVFTTIFVRHSEKLKSLMMGEYVLPWLREIEAISKSHSFASLEVFAVTDDLSFAELGFSTGADPTVTIHNAPLLDTLLLNGLQCAFVFPWTQIVDLRLCAVDARCAMQAVLQCANLEDLSIADLEDTEDENMVFPKGTTVLSRLRSFSFSDYTLLDSWEMGLASHLSFPSLVRLTLGVSLDHFPHHASFLSSLPTTLTHIGLCCDHAKYWTELLLDFLPRWESLRSLLLIVEGKVPIDVINHLVVERQEGNIILPALLRFSLAISTPETWLGRERLLAILELMRSRRKGSRPEGVVRILSLEMSFYSAWLNLKNWPKSFKSGIRELVQDGLDVNIVALDRRVSAPWLERS